MTFDFKNASKSELKQKYIEIGSEINSTKFLGKRELYYLPKLLSEGEQVLAYTTGYMNANSWVIALTDRRIIFIDVGFIYGVKQMTINLEMINSISGETGFIMGRIEIAHGGGAWSIENVFKSTVAPFTTKVRDAIEQRHITLRGGGQTTSSQQYEYTDRPHQPQTPELAEDTYSKLANLSKMLEEGKISRREFETLKSKIMMD